VARQHQCGVERGAYRRAEHDDGAWLIVLDDTMLLAGPHPNYDSPHVNDGDWPQHWSDAADSFLFGE
jgi:hypothetical protein